MAIILKNTKETKTTFSMTFQIEQSDKVDSLREIKALSILLGNYNPLRKEMKEPAECFAVLKSMKESGELSYLIGIIKNQLI